MLCAALPQCCLVLFSFGCASNTKANLACAMLAASDASTLQLVEENIVQVRLLNDCGNGRYAT